MNATHIRSKVNTFSADEATHLRAVAASQNYRRAEAELIATLEEIDRKRIFLRRGHSSLFAYAQAELNLGEDVAYSLITIARKTREIPELQARMNSGEITLTNARRIVPVLTLENSGDWFRKATELSSRELEKEVVKVRPQAATVERASYVTPTRIELKIGLNEKEMLRLRRVQDLLSQRRKTPVSLEEVVNELTQDFIRRQDPVEKAKRHLVRNSKSVASKSVAPKSATSEPAKILPATEVPIGTNDASAGPLLVARRVPSTREPIPAHIRHRVNLRDGRRCTQALRDGSRCNQARWIEIHHRVPVRQGGVNTTENLITLCANHHRLQHSE